MPRAVRVLLIDDRELVRQTLRNALAGFDCDFVEAGDGSAALSQLGAVAFDVIFLDLRLPDLPGLEVLRRARDAGHVKGNVIVLTGLPEPATRAEAKTLGVSRYLEKSPINYEDVRAAFIAAVPKSIEHVPAPAVIAGGEALSRPARHAPIAQVAKNGERSETLPRLLVLDNDSAWLATMARVLGASFNLTLTTSANEACKRARREHFDLVILDMLLVDGVSGLDVLSRMRRAEPELRAIILTGHPDLETAFESAKRGAIRYVSKGDLATLPDIVSQILREHARDISVFLSYTRADLPRVRKWYRRLLEVGFFPWMDVKSIGGGVKWKPEIKKAIKTCDRFVLFISKHSLYKEGELRKEIRQALERQAGMLDDTVFFIPARLEECELESSFSDFECVDLFKRNGTAKLLQALSPNPNDSR